jgi:hypothetical protein
MVDDIPLVKANNATFLGDWPSCFEDPAKSANHMLDTLEI